MTETAEKQYPDWTRGNNPFDVILGGYQVKNILEHARRNKLLDLGCNNGGMLLTLMEDNRFILGFGVDASAKKITEAIYYPSSIEKDVSFVCSTIEEFECQDKFDTITLINVLEHVDTPTQVLDKARSLLTRNGVIIIHVLNRESLNRRLGLKMGLIKTYTHLSERDVKIGHKRFYDQRLLRIQAEMAGLKVEAMGGVMLKPFSNAQMQMIADKWEDSGKVFDGLYKLARDMPEYSSPLWAVCTL